MKECSLEKTSMSVKQAVIENMGQRTLELTIRGLLGVTASSVELIGGGWKGGRLPEGGPCVPGHRGLWHYGCLQTDV